MSQQKDKSAWSVGVLIISDRASRGERGGQDNHILVQLLKKDGYRVSKIHVVPDSRDEIASTLKRWVDEEGLHLIFTTGGTGLSPTDVTPQAMRDVIDYEVPGIAEAMRAYGMTITPHAMLSRAMAGVRKRTLIINLPGSPRAVEENLSVVLPAISHALDKLEGDPTECAR